MLKGISRQRKRLCATAAYALLLAAVGWQGAALACECDTCCDVIQTCLAAYPNCPYALNVGTGPCCCTATKGCCQYDTCGYDYCYNNSNHTGTACGNVTRATSGHGPNANVTCDSTNHDICH